MRGSVFDPRGKGVRGDDPLHLEADGAAVDTLPVPRTVAALLMAGASLELSVQSP